METKEILYAEIDKIGRNYIKTQISNDIFNSKTIINSLFNNCLNFLNKNSLDGDEYVLFSEALLHFILTVSVIPSQRKINIDNIEVDIVIPNSKILKLNNERALIIHFSKDKNEYISESVKNLSYIQKNLQNIWIISSKSINLNLNNFIVSPFVLNQSQYNSHFSEIIVEISEFLKNVNYHGLKIL
ncbi:MAG: hypothetical protein H0X03_01755 [Nitrosopumilus sp.]|nr:hypothetical protein [Nitrosopumilus sp.]